MMRSTHISATNTDECGLDLDFVRLAFWLRDIRVNTEVAGPVETQSAHIVVEIGCARGVVIEVVLI